MAGERAASLSEERSLSIGISSIRNFDTLSKARASVAKHCVRAKGLNEGMKRGGSEDWVEKDLGSAHWWVKVENVEMSVEGITPLSSLFLPPPSQPFFRIHSRVDWFQRDTYACKKIYSNFIFFTLVSVRENENIYENYDCRCG